MKKIPIVESYWVEEGRFLAGEYPGSYDPEGTRHRMDAFLESGIRTFIDLTQPHELTPYEPILKEQARIREQMAVYYRFAIRDHGIPSVQTMTLILDTIDAAIESGSPVYVHCWGGVGRTGTVVGCYLVRHGHRGEAALAQIAQWWQTVEKRNRHPHSPETPAQLQMVRMWREG